MGLAVIRTHRVEAVTCLQWFQCVSPDREPGAETAKYCRIKSCRKR